MVVIFGFGGSSAQDLGETVPARCPNCHNDVYLHHVRSQKQFSLYFVPIAQYGTNEYLLCPICQRGVQVTQQNQQLVLAMRRATVSFRQGHLASGGYVAQVQAFWTTMGMPTLMPAGPAGAPSAIPPLGGAPAAPVTPPAAAAPGPAPASAAPGAGSASAAPSLADQLADLSRLHDAGVLTDAEFEAAKARLIAG